MRVAIQFLEDGTYLVHSDQPIEFYNVDERCPNDRVFKNSGAVLNVGTVDDVIGQSNIGSVDDDRHAAIEAVVEEATGGKPRLSLVEDET